jgi:hypothetical protein
LTQVFAAAEILRKSRWRGAHSPSRSSSSTTSARRIFRTTWRRCRRLSWCVMRRRTSISASRMRVRSSTPPGIPRASSHLIRRIICFASGQMASTLRTFRDLGIAVSAGRRTAVCATGRCGQGERDAQRTLPTARTNLVICLWRMAVAPQDPREDSRDITHRGRCARSRAGEADGNCRSLLGPSNAHARDQDTTPCVLTVQPRADQLPRTERISWLK